MQLKRFIELAKRTESVNNPFNNNIKELGYSYRLDHAIDGLVTERNEQSSAILELAALAQMKVVKDHELVIDTLTNLLEEIGDILWFTAIAIDELFDLDEYFDLYTKDVHTIITETVFQDLISHTTIVELGPEYELLDMGRKTKYYGKLFDRKTARYLIIMFLRNINDIRNKFPHCVYNNIQIEGRYEDDTGKYLITKKPLDIDFNDIAKMVIEKLQIRYPDKFDKEQVLNKDKSKEQNIFREYVLEKYFSFYRLPDNRNKTEE